MSTLAQLRSLISDKTGGDFTSSQIDSQINSTIDFYKRRRFWFNQESANITLNANDPVVPNIPADFLHEIRDSGFIINYSQSRYPLFKISPSKYAYINEESIGLPEYYTYRDGQFLLYFYPDIAYDLELYYIQNPTTLSDDSDTNIFTDNATRMIEYKTMADLYYTYRQDETGKAQQYDALAEREYFELQKQTNALNATGYLEIDSIVDDGYRGSTYYY